MDANMVLICYFSSCVQVQRPCGSMCPRSMTMRGYYYSSQSMARPDTSSSNSLAWADSLASPMSQRTARKRNRLRRRTALVPGSASILAMVLASSMSCWVESSSVKPMYLSAARTWLWLSSSPMELCSRALRNCFRKAEYRQEADFEE